MKKQQIRNDRGAFTLAEVLIALTIIGIVAALTVPTMIQSYQEKATVAKLRTVYSTLNQAFYMAKTDYGSPDTWDWGTSWDGPSAVKVFNQYFKPYLKVQKDCGTGTGCWYDGMMKLLHGTDNTNRNLNIYLAKAILADGTSLALATLNNSCNAVYGTSSALRHVCSAIYVDINGSKNPNMYGKDFFAFLITTEGVIPFGTPADTNSSISERCNLNSTNQYNGESCTAWIIEKGNMDYLRKEVSW